MDTHRPLQQNYSSQTLYFLRRFVQRKALECLERPGLQFESARYHFPSLPEQRKIARILSTVDEVIERTEALIAKYQAMKQGLMHDLLTRGVDASGRLRRPRDLAPELYRWSEVGWVPRGWEVGTINDFCNICNHLRMPISAEERGKIQGDYPYYGPTGILDFINEYRVDGTYVLIGEDGDHFLKFASWPMTILVTGKFNVNNHAHLLQGKEGCSTEWIHTYFCHRDITAHLTRQGAGRFKLNQAALREIPLGVPQSVEQIQINQIFDQYGSTIENELQYFHKLRLLKTGLMQDLLTGRVEVKI